MLPIISNKIILFEQSKQEAVLFEIEFLKNDILNALSSLDSWSKVERVRRIYIILNRFD